MAAIQAPRYARPAFSRNGVVRRGRACLHRLVLWLVLACAVLSSSSSRAGERIPDDPVVVDRIEIRGLSRTTEVVVRREIGFAEGDVVTRAAIDLAITRLWNTTIFAHVEGHVERRPEAGGNRNVVVFELEDRWTLNPLLSFGSGGGALFVRAGATDNNLAGRYLEAYALYENFDGFHGGLAYFRDPRFLGRRLELMVQADRLIRPRPGFADQRTEGVLEIAQLAMSDRVRAGMRWTFFTDRFIAPLDSPPAFPAPTETMLLEPRARFGRIDTVRVRQRGISIEARPAVGFTTSDVASRFTGLSGELLAFLMPGDRWNFALRARAATMTPAPPHLQMYAGGLDLVRGFPDNYVRTRALALANVEARFVAFDSTWVALIPAAFVDVVAARSPHGAPGAALSAGGGVRIIVPKFVASGLRADIAFPLATSLRPVTFDEAEYGPPTPLATLGGPQPSFGIFQFF